MMPHAKTKRVVVYIVKGRLAGMRKIIGRLVIDANADLADVFPPSIEPVDLGDHTGKVLHAGTFERFVLYREWAKPVAQTFGGALVQNIIDPREA